MIRPTFSDLFIRLRSLFRRTAVEGELDAELRFHFDHQVEKYVGSGLSREKALRRARLEFGALDNVKEECRDARGVSFLETLAQDVRYGLRMLRKNPGFTAIAVLTLALGIGANTAIFSVVDSVLLQPLPFPEPGQLVTIYGTFSKLNEMSRALSYPDFADLRMMNTVFEHVAAYSESSVTLTGAGAPLHLDAADVGADMFSVLHILPVLGRSFAPDEDRAGAYVAILSHRLWQSQFHGDPGVIGRAVAIDGRSYIIVGVMPPGFTFPLDSGSPEMWTTFAGLSTPVNGQKPESEERGAHFLRAIARLKPGVSLEQANQETGIIGGRLAKQYPVSNADLGLRSVSALDALVGNVRPQLYILLGAVALVLLIACANVANLLLSRATRRHREIAIRAALGASRGRIVRQLLIESAILSLAGGACGLVIAVWGSDMFARLAAHQLPRLAGAAVDARALAFTFIASLATGMLFGIAPALQLSRLELTETLKESGRSGGQSSRQSRLRNLLVVTEMTLAVILLSGAGLLMKSLLRLERVNPGFDPRGVLTYAVDLPDSRYPKPAQAEAFFRQLFERVRRLPGVQATSGTMPLPLSGDVIRTSLEVEGHPMPNGDSLHVHARMIGFDYFRTMSIPLLQGRDFKDTDRAGAPYVVIINKELADKSFPGENPIGKRIKPGFGEEGGVDPWREIVGVVGNVKHAALNRPDTIECYLPQDQEGNGTMWGVVRTDLPPASLVSAIREQVKALDEDVPLYDVETMDHYVANSVALPRLDSTVFGIFSGLALLLAVIGIYGVMSYGVAQRTSEFGIRMTLGAQGRDVLRLVLVQGLKIAGVGVVLGVIGALAASRLLASLLFGASLVDPLTIAGAVVVLVACSLLACYIPARRAMRVDPMVALRYE
jgi:putative ABC transport system permease protein